MSARPALTAPATESAPGRIVVKVGSALLTERGALSPAAIDRLVDDVAALQHRVEDVVLVVSGAVAAGYRCLGEEVPPDSVVARQAAASVGQPRLFARLADAFDRRGLAIAQLLLTADDVEDRRRFLSARHTLGLLLSRGVIPVINENDAVSDDEIQVGDNDHLAALVAVLASAEKLIVLSQTNGVRARADGGARIPVVEAHDDIRRHFGNDRSATGVGGIEVKVAAARLAARYGIETSIGDGRVPGELARLAEGADVGTRFPARAHALTPHRRWIAVRSRSRGTIVVSSLATARIRRGVAGLGTADVREVVGNFSKGARVELQDEAGHPFAVGLVSYTADEIRRMAGRDAAQLEALLGYRYVDEVIQPDDLVPLGPAADQTPVAEAGGRR